MSLSALQYLNNSNENKSFIGVFHYTRPVRSKHEESVEIYGLLSINSPIDIPGQNIAKFAWDGLVDGFEYSNEDSMNGALKSGLKESTRRVKQLIVNDKEISIHGVDIHFCVFVSTPAGLYVGSIGESDIYVYKKDKIVDISEMLKKNNANTAGLALEEGDLLFCSTESFLKKNMEKLIGLKSKEEILKTLDDVAHLLSAGEGLLIFAKGEEEIEEENIVVEEVVVSVEEEIVPEAEVGILEPPKERDLKSVLSSFFSKVSKPFTKIKLPKLKFKEFFNKVFTFVKQKTSLLFTKVGEGLKKNKQFKKIFAKISQSKPNVGKKEEFKGFTVDGYKVRSKKVERFRIAILVLVGIVLLVGGVKFTIDQKEARAISNEANRIFTMVGDLLSKAEEKSRTDATGAGTFLLRAENELEKVPVGLSKKDEAKRDNLEGKVLGIQDTLYKRVGVDESSGSIESFLTTRLAFGEGSKPTDIVIYQDDNNNEYLLVVDSGLKGVFRVSLYDKEVKKLPDTEKILQDPRMIYVGKSGIFVLDYKVGVVRAKYTSDGWFENFTKLTGLSIDNIGAGDISEFAVLTSTDNVYVLDRSTSSLLKSTNVGSGYGLSHAYLKNDAFKEANDILADLSIYILTSGENGLHRYVYSYFEQKQVPAPLEVLGLEGNFKNLAYGYTRKELTFDLYLFDDQDRRVMRFEKPIEGGGEIRHPNQIVLINQYLYRGDREDVWKDVKDLAVDKEQKYIYILDASVVWKVRM
ncbi:MAG: hypothetical protein ACOX0X_01880 [Candidatus Dojkabacteria bacterium]